MKTIWIKLVVALGLVLLVVGGLIFWPTETEPEDTMDDLKTPPQVQQTRVESLYQMALSHKERDNPSDMDFWIMADCCWKILTDYPDSPQAVKARRLPIQDDMRWDDERYVVTSGEDNHEDGRFLRFFDL